MIEQVACNKSSVLLKIILQNMQITTIYKDSQNRIFFKMPRLKAWAKRPTGLIKRGSKRKYFKREYLD